MNRCVRKILSKISTGLMMLLLLTTNVSALSIEPVGDGIGSDLFFGQNHYYSVIFRVNGEAIVYAKLVVTNSGDEPMTDFSFEVPKVDPYEMTAFQMELPKVCVEYDYSKSYRQGDCLRYRDPDYNGYYYYYSSGEATYSKTKYNKSGRKYTLQLPNELKPQKTTAFLVTYAAKGYVQSSFGRMKFDFETLKVDSRIQNLDVAVDVDSDLVLRGKRAELDYSSGQKSLTADSAIQAGINSVELDKMQGSIGRYGVLEKSAKSLAPGESFVVRGEYATTWLKLYTKQILVVLAVIATIAAGLVYLAKWLRKRRSTKAKVAKKTTSTNVAASKKTTETGNEESANMPFYRYVVFGFIAAGVVLVLIGLISLIADWGLWDKVAYSPVLILLILLILALIFVILLFGPAIYVGFKYGWRKGAMMFFIEFGWIIILSIIVAIFVLMSSSGSLGRYPHRYYN